MNFGLFEPLFGKQIPKEPASKPVETPTPKVSTPSPKSKGQKAATDQAPELFKAVEHQLGNLFSELDQSKVMIITLVVAVAIMVVFFFYLNSRQKSQKQLMHKMQKQLNRLRG
jgi:cell division protein FtsL